MSGMSLAVLKNDGRIFASYSECLSAVSLRRLGQGGKLSSISLFSGVLGLDLGLSEPWPRSLQHR